MRERRREERADEQPPDLGGGFAREDEARTQADDAHAGMLALEAVEQPLDLGLVAGVEAALDAFGRP